VLQRVMFVFLHWLFRDFFFCLAHVLCLFCFTSTNPRSLYLSGSEILTATLTALPKYRSPSFFEAWEALHFTWPSAEIAQLPMDCHMSLSKHMLRIPARLARPCMEHVTLFFVRSPPFFLSLSLSGMSYTYPDALACAWFFNTITRLFSRRTKSWRLNHFALGAPLHTVRLQLIPRWPLQHTEHTEHRHRKGISLG